MEKGILKRLMMLMLAGMMVLGAAACSKTDGGVDFDGEGRFYYMRPAADDTTQTTHKVYSMDAQDGGFKQAAVLGKFNNLFEAIDEIAVSGKKGDLIIDTKIRSGKQTVFQREASNRELYLYTGMDFKGKAENEAAAKEFLAANPKSHAVFSNAVYFAHSYTKYSGIEPTLFEPETGGSYVYKFAQGLREFVAVKQTIKLAGAKISYSKNNLIPYNVFIFLSSIGDGGVGDCGIGSPQTDNGVDVSNGIMRAFCYTQNGFKYIEGDDAVITVPVENPDVPGEYIYQDDLEMTYSLSAEGFYFEIKNLTTGHVFSHTESVDLSASYKNRKLLAGTSFVPHLKLNGRKVWDPDCGAYFTGVGYEDCKIYDAAGNEFDFSATATATETCFAYANSGAEYIIGQNGRETANIFYK